MSEKVLHVAFIHSDESFAKRVIRRLEDAGINSKFFNSNESLLEELEGEIPQIIVAQFSDKNINGLKIALAIKSIPEGTRPQVILIGRESKSHLRLAMSAGVAEYIGESASYLKVQAVVQTWLKLIKENRIERDRQEGSVALLAKLKGEKGNEKDEKVYRFKQDAEKIDSKTVLNISTGKQKDLQTERKNSPGEKSGEQGASTEDKFMVGKVSGDLKDDNNTLWQGKGAGEQYHQNEGVLKGKMSGNQKDEDKTLWQVESGKGTPDAGDVTKKGDAGSEGRKKVCNWMQYGNKNTEGNSNEEREQFEGTGDIQDTKLRGKGEKVSSDNSMMKGQLSGDRIGINNRMEFSEDTNSEMGEDALRRSSFKERFEIFRKTEREKNKMEGAETLTSSNALLKKELTNFEIALLLGGADHIITGENPEDVIEEIVIEAGNAMENTECSVFLFQNEIPHELASSDSGLFEVKTIDEIEGGRYILEKKESYIFTGEASEKSYMTIPLIDNDEVMGCFYLRRLNGSGFSVREKELIQNVVKWTGRIIKNCYLNLTMKGRA